MMTVASLREKTRRLLADSVAPYRWSDAEIRDGLQAAVRRLNDRVPATRYVECKVQDCTVLPQSDTDAIALDDKYAEAIAMYAAYLAYLNDATDTVNAERAGALLARAEALMV